MKYHPITLLHKKQGLELIRKLMSFFEHPNKKDPATNFKFANSTQPNPTFLFKVQ